jgi:hypothetical protein
MSRSTTTIKNVHRIGGAGETSALVDVTVTRPGGSGIVTLDIGPSSNSNLVKRYAIPLGDFLRLVTAVAAGPDPASADFSDGRAPIGGAFRPQLP